MKKVNLLWANPELAQVRDKAQRLRVQKCGDTMIYDIRQSIMVKNILVYIAHSVSGAQKY